LAKKDSSAIVNLRITKEGEIPKPGALLVSNHISWLDIIVIGQYLPAYFVAKSDILRLAVIGYLSKQGGTIFIRQGRQKAYLRRLLKKMVLDIKTKQKYYCLS